MGVCERRDVEIGLAGKPTQNAYVESFYGRFGDDCLTEHWFTYAIHGHRRVAPGLQGETASLLTELLFSRRVRGETSRNSGCACRNSRTGQKGLY